MLWINVVLFLWICAARPLEAQNVTTNFTLYIGVYSPSDTGWDGILREAMGLVERLAPDETPSLGIEFLYINNDFPFTLQNVNIASDILSSKEISVVVGPFNHVVKLAAEDLAIPYFVTSNADECTGVNEYTFHMLPRSQVVHDMVLDLVQQFKWKEAAVLYDQHQGLHLMGHLMTLPEFIVRSWQLDMDEIAIRQKLLEMRQLEARHLIVVCETELLEKLFRVALKLSMLSDRYSWVVVSLNPHVMNYTTYMYTLVNYTTFQFFNNEELSEVEGRERLDTAIALDVLETVLHSSQNVMDTTNLQCPPNCNKVITGRELTPSIATIQLNSSTGNVQFSSNNERGKIHVKVQTLTMEGLDEIGVWVQGLEKLKDRLLISYDHNFTRVQIHPLGRGPARVVTLLEDPFVMYKPDYQNRVGNDRFEGFLIDLIDHIARKLDFTYILYTSPDGNYGSKQDNGSWNGMINELIQGHASMCLGAISITSDRESVVDFAKPYKQKQFNILMKKPKEKRSIFQFLWPLSIEVWLLTTSSIIALGILLFVMDRISPNSLAEDEGRFNFKESLWFIYGSLVGAGTEMVPRTISGRLLTGAWWFFALILISSYTANLAAFLTVTKIEAPIKSIADLATQTKIKYGTVRETYANSFLKNNKMDIFRKMWNFIQLSDSMVNNGTEGVQRVQEGDYAFIWDAPINRYTTMLACDTMTVGQPFDEKGYGIGVPLGASYRDDITMAILNLNEEGIIQQAEDKWWSGGHCEEFQETTTGGTKELGLHQVAGVFLVLAVGAVVALVACFFEFIILKIKSRKKANANRGAGIERDSSTLPLRSSLYVNGQSASEGSAFFYNPRKESAM